MITAAFEVLLALALDTSETAQLDPDGYGVRGPDGQTLMVPTVDAATRAHATELLRLVWARVHRPVSEAN